MNRSRSTTTAMVTTTMVTTAMVTTAMVTTAMATTTAIVFACLTGQAPARADSSSPSILEVGTEINATLNRPVNAGSVRIGDEVTAKVVQDVEAGGQVVAPKGSTLVGRVTRAEPRKSRSGGISASELGIVFYRITLKNGSRVALKGFIGAVARSSAEDKQRSMLGTIAGVRGGGVQGSPRAPADDGINREKRSSGSRGGADWRGTLTPGSRGVFGFEDLELTASADSGVMLVSRQSNTKLESGTQLLVVCAGSPEDPS